MVASARKLLPLSLLILLTPFAFCPVNASVGAPLLAGINPTAMTFVSQSQHLVEVVEVQAGSSYISSIGGVAQEGMWFSIVLEYDNIYIVEWSGPYFDLYLSQDSNPYLSPGDIKYAGLFNLEDLRNYPFDTNSPIPITLSDGRAVNFYGGKAVFTDAQTGVSHELLVLSGPMPRDVPPGIWYVKICDNPSMTAVAGPIEITPPPTPPFNGIALGAGVYDPLGSSGEPLEGVARFSFNVRCFDGIAEGNLIFQHSFLMHLRSTSIAIAIDVDGKVQFEGSAMVNNEDGFHFIATAGDSPDDFAIEILDASGLLFYASHNTVLHGVVRIDPR